MSKNKDILRVPFNTTNSYVKGLLSYPETWRVDEWRDNHTFVATLRLDGFQRGRSAAHAMWIDVETEYHYPMFLTFLEEIMKRSVIQNGIIAGEFTFAKRGTNYSIKMVFDDE